MPQHAKLTKDGRKQVVLSSFRHFISDIGTTVAGSRAAKEHPKELSTRVPSHLKDVLESALQSTQIGKATIDVFCGALMLSIS